METGKKWKNKSGTRIYYIWRNMRQRCLNIKNDSWYRYGERGISVYDKWINNYDEFYYWAISNGYSDNLSLDRIDNNGDYYPENCRWVTMETQQNNRSDNIYIEYNGKIQTITQWCKDLKLNPTSIGKRYSKYNAKEFSELFTKENLRSYRVKKLERMCKICSSTDSIKWRIGLCNNCYAKALRWSKRTGNDIAGYAILAEQECKNE